MGDQQEPTEIYSVWSNDFENYFSLLEEAVKEYPIVAIDTEFAGMLDKGETTNNFELYAQMRSNVNRTKCIQVGFALSKQSGEVHPNVWEFNLRFDVKKDLHDLAAINVLKESKIDFVRLAEDGIEGYKFAEALLESRLLKFNSGSDNITWVTYHGCYDFLHLIKLCLLGTYAPSQVNPPDLPEDLEDFHNMLCSFIGDNTYDVKLLGAYNDPAYYGSLESLCNELGLERIGTSHQAGSDAFVTLNAYLNLKDSTSIDCCGLLYGLFHEFNDI